MQMANSAVGDPLLRRHVRPATPTDAGAIQRLIRAGVYVHVHVDWHLPGDWLGQPGFVVYTRWEREDGQIVACLGIGADPLPAAWVRVAAVESVAAFAQCEVMWVSVLETLDPAIGEVAWFLTDNWPQRWLERLGLARSSTVLSFRKDDLEAAPYAAPPGLAIRPVLAEDMPVLAEIEMAAFEPRWRHSARGLQLAWRQALSFDVALLDGVPAGYQLSTGGSGNAHLARMTVDPRHQGRGIGAALLTHALQGYRRRKVYSVTLNTQQDNVISQRLYGRFGFQPTGHQYPVWSYYP